MGTSTKDTAAALRDCPLDIPTPRIGFAQVRSCRSVNPVHLNAKPALLFGSSLDSEPCLLRPSIPPQRGKSSALHPLQCREALFPSSRLHYTLQVELSCWVKPQKLKMWCPSSVKIDNQ